MKERILAMGITGSGKSYQWLKIAEMLLEKGAVMRVIDTDAAIEYMLDTQFPQLKPENGGNVYVFPAFTWQDYRLAKTWVLQQPLKKEEEKLIPDSLMKIYIKKAGPLDWNIVDMIDNAWTTVQRYFVSEVFEEDIGDYFLYARKMMRQKGDKDEKGAKIKTVMAEALGGWVDWPVINKLYEDWVLPLVYRSQANFYATTKVQEIGREDKKNPEIMSLFGGLGVRPSGQKNIGHQVHTIHLLIPGTDEWFIRTVKDRAGRKYFKKDKLSNYYMQYLVAKAGWDV